MRNPGGSIPRDFILICYPPLSGFGSARLSQTLPDTSVTVKFSRYMM